VAAALAPAFPETPVALSGRWHVSGGSELELPLTRLIAEAGGNVTSGTGVPSEATQVVLLHGLRALSDPAAADAAVQAGFQTLREFGQRHRDDSGRVIVVQDTGGDFGLTADPGPRAVLGALAGLAKTAAQEWPAVRVAAIDLGPSLAGVEARARALCREIGLGPGTGEVGIDALGWRSSPRLQAVAPAADSSRPPPEPDRAWVVSGGARGVTAHCLIALARRVRLKWAIFGRTPLEEKASAAVGAARSAAELTEVLLGESRARGDKLSPAQLRRQVGAELAAREVRETCAQLRALGSEVRYVALDIADRDAVAAAVADVRRAWGPIRGLVHAAGVLADKALHDQTDAQFAAVYRTKVDGLRTLLAATAADPLAELAIFSSVAARAGNAGQGAYAAANEALNKLGQAERHRRGDRCSVHAINWGPWDGGMVTPALKAHFAGRGIPLIPLAAGAECFADLLTGGRPVPVECVVGALIEAAGASCG